MNSVNYCKDDAEGIPSRSLWIPVNQPHTIRIIDQRYLPFQLVTEDLKTADDCFWAIRDMHVRGAPLIGITAAFGMYLGLLHCKGKDPDRCAEMVAEHLAQSRPTAVNLFFTLRQVLVTVHREPLPERKVQAAYQTACRLMEQEIAACRFIGEHGLPLIEEISRRKKGDVVHILTHCNAGWLACIAYGTATAPIYLARERGIDVHVWVDETRPLNQGSRLTTWELQQNGVPCTIITDNAGGYLMQKGMVDLVLVGTDRTHLNGDVINKTGTYLKALAANDNGVPFYVALPSSSLDPEKEKPITDVLIEERSEDEIHYLEGLHDKERIRVRITPEGTNALNPAFDITPARLLTGFITDRGICKATPEDLLRLFPEYGDEN